MVDLFDSMKARMEKELLRSAVSRKMFCDCGNILDVGNAVLVDMGHRMFLSCGKCFHEVTGKTGKTQETILQGILQEHPEWKDKVQILDGKVLSKKTRMPKCKFPKDMRPDPLKMGFLTPTEKEPRMAELDAMLMDSVCEATDGCTVEADGKCEHGHVSWLRYFGIV